METENSRHADPDDVGGEFDPSVLDPFQRGPRLKRIAYLLRDEDEWADAEFLESVSTWMERLESRDRRRELAEKRAAKQKGGAA